MAGIARMTITLPADMATGVRTAVAGGDYASSSEVVREALREWKARRAHQQQARSALQTDIDQGLADLAQNRVHDFDVARIVARGGKRLRAASSG